MTYIILEIVFSIIAIVALVTILAQLLKNEHVSKFLKRRTVYIALAVLVLSSVLGLLSNRTYPPHFAMPAFMHSFTPAGGPPWLPVSNVLKFFRNVNHFENVADIGADPNGVPPKAQKPDADGIVKISMTVKEVIAEIAPGISFNYWTFDKQVPGPMLRVKEGDTVQIRITNHRSSLHHHNIDLHAVTGPGGGATLSHVKPGETKVFQFKTLNPGLYIYHCAMPNISSHNSHGQYGLILVDPKEGLPEVDREFYIVQGELYTIGQLGKKGLARFDSQALLDGRPNYVTFNGKVETTPRMQAKVGDKIRIYVGNGGVNLISSFHVIGEIFDTVYPNASIGGALERNTQTALVLPGGASIVEFTVDTPGKYLLVDHALARMNKGTWAVLEVTGKDNPDVLKSVPTGTEEVSEGESHDHGAH